MKPIMLRNKRRYEALGWFGVVGTLLMVFLVIILPGWLKLMSLSGVYYANIGVASFFARMELSDTRLMTSVGPYQQKVDLGNLQSVKYKSKGRSGLMTITDKSGGKVRVNVLAWERADVWAVYVKEAAYRCGAYVDDRAKSSLDQADRKHGGWLA